MASETNLSTSLVMLGAKPMDLNAHFLWLIEGRVCTKFTV